MEKLLMASFFKAENICFFLNFKNCIPFGIDMSFCPMNAYENKSDVCTGILHMCVCVSAFLQQKGKVQSKITLADNWISDGQLGSKDGSCL